MSIRLKILVIFLENNNYYKQVKKPNLLFLYTIEFKICLEKLKQNVISLQL